MSMELYVLSDRELGSIAEWQKAIDAQRFALALSSARSFASLRGLLPARLDGAQADFECDHWNPGDVQEDVAFDRRWRFCLAFRWGADLKACVAAYMTAAAYASATEGMVFDCEQGELLKPKEAIQLARDIETQLPAMEEALRSATNRLEQ